MKRVRPVNPSLPTAAREEIDLRSRSRDSRRDPQATAKISREELEEVLKRSNSGMRAAVRPETAGEPRTQSGERVAVRPDGTEKVSSDRPTARPAAIEVGDTHDSQSDALADEMYRAVQARSSAMPVSAPARDLAPTVMQPPFAHVEPASPPAAIAATIPETPEPEHLAVHEDDPVAIRVRRTRIAVALVVATSILAVVAWFAGRYVGVLLQH